MDAISFSILFLVTFGLIYEQIIKLMMDNFEELPNQSENLTNIEVPVHHKVI